jgi:excisionase family DNA binding protein
MSANKEAAGPKQGSLKHAAAKIGCSLPTLYELMAAGKLRSYHIGRAHRVSDQAISDCIALLEHEEREHHVSCPPTLRNSEATRE